MKIMCPIYLITFVILVSSIDRCLSCEGYSAKILSVNNCNATDGVIVVDTDMAVRLTKKCFIIATGCVNVKGFQTADLEYSIKKDGAKVLSGNKDMCKEAEEADPQVKAVMNMLAIPDKCPMSAGKLCSDDSKKVDIGKYKSMLGMARGKIDATFHITHDTGVTCIKAEVQISKK